MRVRHPGAAILPLYDAMRGSSIRHLTVRQEGATHAADGYSRATGGIGVAIGTSGPAGTNMVTGLYTAWADSVPILTITGQVPVAQLDREGFQAVDIAEIVRPVVKKSTWSPTQGSSRGPSSRRSGSCVKGAPGRCTSTFPSTSS